MSADFEDWTRGLELVVDDMSDFPDWTVAAQVTGGSSGGYKSLTGPGETATPGALTQAGDLTVNGHFSTTSADCSLATNVTVGAFGDNTVINAGNTVFVSGAGFDFDTNVGTFSTGSDGFHFNNVPGFGTHMDTGLGVAESLGVTYGIASAGATQTPGITLTDLGVATTEVGFYVHHGSPVGVITVGTGLAGFCIDTATPKLWAWAQGASGWVGV